MPKEYLPCYLFLNLWLLSMLLILLSNCNLKQEETFRFVTEIEIKVCIYMARRRATEKKESPVF